MTRPLYISVLLLALAMLAFPSAVQAGKHPVPLEKDTDNATCIACHEDKTKGESVHTAVATGCLSCHEVRVNRDVTRVMLTTATTASLCLQCHADKNAAEIKGKVHQPAVRDCATCHDPHTSENKYQLVKATAGDKSTNLCLTCHTTGEKVPETGSRHLALDMGCESCHVTHKTGPAGVREFDYHLSKDAPALCADCHDLESEQLQQAHQNQPFATADCLTCHDPHASAGPKLVQKFVHQPFGAGMCNVCHEAPQDGKVVLTQPDAQALCLTCHEEQAKKIETAAVPHPGAMGSCTDCHGAHAGKSPGFPKPDAVNVCLSCHTEQAEQQKKKYLHQPAFEQGCATCHEPHGGENPKLLRASNINNTCLECHGPDPQPVQVKGQKLVTIFDGKVKLPQDYFSKVVRLPIRYGLGHPVEHHPVQDQMDPQDVSKVRVALNCASCHQPHSSQQPGLLINDQANNMAFCASCHKNLGPQ